MRDLKSVSILLALVLVQARAEAQHDSVPYGLSSADDEKIAK
jgi:hypothetical protein